MYAATLSLEVQGAVANAVEGALSVEVGGGIPTVSAKLTRTADDLRVHLMSEDLPTLRAAVNSFLRWAAMAAEVSLGAKQVPETIDLNTPHEGT